MKQSFRVYILLLLGIIVFGSMTFGALRYFGAFLWFDTSNVHFIAKEVKSSAMDIEHSEITVEYSDFGSSTRGETMVIHFSGVIMPGDAERIRSAIELNIRPKPRGIHFSFDSPGGNLLEGIAIGKLIASRPELTTSLLGTTKNPNATCASACVFAYIGADTREKTPQARLGLHQVSVKNEHMTNEDALGLGQIASATVVSYLTERNASTAIFERMVMTKPGDIDWISDSDLLKLGIIGGEIIHQSSEFINIDGKAVLKMEFEAQTGKHVLHLGCNNPGVFLVASVVAYDDSGEVDDVALIFDDERVNPSYLKYMGFKNRRLNYLLGIPPKLAIQAMSAQSIGIYYHSKNEKQWVGNMQEIDQTKFSSLVTSCKQG